MSNIRSLSQLRGMTLGQEAFVRLDQNSGQLTASGVKARFWQSAQKALEKAETKAAAELIRKSVCTHCGNALGTRLFERYLGSKTLQGKLFTTENLKKLLNAAAESNVSYLLRKHADVMGPLSLDTGLAAELGHIGVSPEDFVSFAGSTVRLMEENCFGREAFEDASERLGGLMQDLADMEAKLAAYKADHAGADVSRLENCLKDAHAQLLEKQTALVEQRNNNPFIADNVRGAFRLMYAAYEKVVGSLLSKPSVQADPSAQNSLSSLLLRIAAEKDSPSVLRGMRGTDMVSDDLVAGLNKLPEAFVKELRQIFPEEQAAVFKEMLKSAHIQVLNQQDWNVIQRNIQFMGQGGRSVSALSVITPAVHIGNIGSHMTALGITDQGTQGTVPIQGVTCEDRGQAQHALNLAATEVSVGGTTLFQGIRHGINSAYTIKNDTERLQANAVRAREIFTAALNSSPHFLQQARQAGPDDVIDLPMLSASLVTPDFVREIGSASERTYLREQCDSWKNACESDGTCKTEIALPDGSVKTVTVRPRVLTFNFGVNSGGQGFLGTALRSWNVSDAYNKEALEGLFGSDGKSGFVGQYLSSHPNLSETEKNQITVLRSQIMELFESKAYRAKGEDPYRLPARLAMLGWLTGMMPLFNCKSGKDRTGQMDVACKTLALQMYADNGRIPPLHVPRTTRDEQIFHQTAINGGNLELQRLNTGLAGFKTNGVAGLDALFGREALKIHRGFSHYVKV